MVDRTDYERGMIVGTRVAGTTVTETAILVGVGRRAVSTVMTAYCKQGKTSSVKHNSGRKSKLIETEEFEF